MKRILLAVLFFSFFFISNAQYRTFKNNYDIKLYKFERGDRYNLTTVGASSIFPGGGHFYAQQPGRGLLFLGGTAVSAYFIVYGSLESWASGWSSEGSNKGETISYAALFSFLGIYTWSFFDAQKVAKIKNMHFRHTTFSTQLIPYYRTEQGSNTIGLALNISF